MNNKIKELREAIRCLEECSEQYASFPEYSWKSSEAYIERLNIWRRIEGLLSAIESAQKENSNP